MSTKEPIKQAVQHLAYANPNNYERRFLEIARFGSAAVEPLIEGLSSSDEKVVRYASELLGIVGDERAIEPLLKVLEIYGKLNYQAVRTLGLLKVQQAVQPLLDLLNSFPNSEDILYVLGEIGDQRTSKTLLFYIQTASRDALAAAFGALGLIKDPVTVPLLIEILLKHSDENRRTSAASVLGKIGDDQAVEPLLEVLHEVKTAPSTRPSELLPHYFLRQAVTVALKQFNHADAKEAVRTEVSFFLELFKRPNLQWNAPQAAILAADMEASVAITLGEIASSSEVEVLLPYLMDTDPKKRVRAASILGAIGDSRAFIPLLEISYDEDVYIRRASISALAQLRSLDTLDRLAEAISDKEEAIRRSSVWGLGELDDVRTITPLEKALNDLDKLVQSAAVQALLKKIQEHQQSAPLYKITSN